VCAALEMALTPPPHTHTLGGFFSLSYSDSLHACHVVSLFNDGPDVLKSSCIIVPSKSYLKLIDLKPGPEFQNMSKKRSN
jgi:hypothetical protein